MKYIITESQNDYLNKWNKFTNFMKRREGQILNLLAVIHDYKGDIPDIDSMTSNTLDYISDKFITINQLHNSEFEDWVYPFLDDNYREITKQMIQKIKNR